MAYRGIDITDAEDPESKLTLRKLWIYYDRLPTRNEVTRELMDMNRTDFDNMWDVNTAVLADIFDAIQQNTVAVIKTIPKAQVQKPKPYPRPKYGKEEKPAKKVLPFKTMHVQKKGGELP